MPNLSTGQTYQAGELVGTLYAVYQDEAYLLVEGCYRNVPVADLTLLEAPAVPDPESDALAMPSPEPRKRRAKPVENS